MEEVCVHTFTSAARLSKIVPKDTDEAQYNIAWPVASAIVHGDVGYRQVCNKALNDNRVGDIMKKLRFVVDPELDAQFPEKRLAWVEFALKDGRRLRSRVYAANGEASDRIDMDWMQKKFRRITAPFLSEAGQKEVLDLLTGDLNRKLREIVSGVNRALKDEPADS